MKKDKEWLKKKMIYLKEAVGKPAVNDFSRGLNGAYDTLELLIDQLDEPELPVIPKFAADWYEEHKDNIYYHVSKKIQSAENNNDKSMCLELIEFWLMDFENENIGKILKMKGGYTIEQPKKYRVKVSDELFFVKYHELEIIFIKDDAPGFIEIAKVFDKKEDAEKVAKDLNGYIEQLSEDDGWVEVMIEQPKLLTVIVKSYDKTIMTKQMPEDEVNKMMEGMSK